MSHSFVAYIDESGDEGFVFKDFPERASSEWFVLSALMVPTQLEMREVRGLSATIEAMERARGNPIHFSKLNHEQRVAVCEAIGMSKFRVLNIAIDKRRLQSQFLKQGYALYFYTTRYLVERISWLARDKAGGFEGDGRVKLVFSNRTRMSYDDLRSYLSDLRAKRDGSDHIHWPAIDPRS